MKRFIVLLRGINVGGKNLLPMVELRQGLESIGLLNVQTYIQSGNVVFDSKNISRNALATEIAEWIQRQYNINVRLIVLRVEELGLAIVRNPFPAAAAEPQKLHLFFLSTTPKSPNLAAIENSALEGELWELKDQVFYLYSPQGAGKSKLAASAERFLGIQATARNFRTTQKLYEMAL